MRYIYGFNPALVQALGYGKQVHNILNILHKLAQQTGGIPNEEAVRDAFAEHFYLRYAAREQEDLLRASAQRSVAAYMGLWHDDLSLSVHTERPFEMDIENALLSGSIDLLKRQNNDGDSLEIVDFKTGKNRGARDELDLQVRLYTVAAREALNLDVQKAHIHYLDDAKQKRVEIETTPAQLDRTMKTVSAAVQGITTRRFARNPKNKKSCKSCDWNGICPQKN